MTGIFVLEVDDDEAQDFLRGGSERINRMTRELVSDIAEHAAEEIRALAPGRIKGFVDFVPERFPEPGTVEAWAGVTPANISSEGKTQVQIGSDPADYPWYVEAGTGEHGEFGTAITVPPGNVMVFPYKGSTVFARSVKGQEPQRYVERSYENTIAWVPAKLATLNILPE